MNLRPPFFVLLALVSSAFLVAGDRSFRVTRSDAERYIAQAKEQHFRGDIQTRDAVSDAKTAITLAVAVWTPIYGTDVVGGSKQYEAIRVGEYWFVCKRPVRVLPLAC